MLLETENILYWISGWFDNTSLESVSFFVFFPGLSYSLQFCCWRPIADYICRYFINSVVHRIVKNTKAEWDDMLFDRKLLNKLALTVPAVMIYFLIPAGFSRATGGFIMGTETLYCLYHCGRSCVFFNSFLNILLELTNRKEKLRDRPVKGLFQTLQVLLFFVGTIFIISVIIDKSPLSLFAGLGASARNSYVSV